MNDETTPRSIGTSPSGGRDGGSAGEQSPLQARAAFLKNWDWELVVGFNRGACQRSSAQHGANQESHGKVQTEWAEQQQRELTLAELLQFLRHCHRSAPFLFFNGNTFADIARRMVDLVFAELPAPRRREVVSAVAHYVAGVLDWEPMHEMIDTLCASADLVPGSRVKTLRGSVQGVVLRVLEDGRIVWRTESGTELMTLPETLTRSEG